MNTCASQRGLIGPSSLASISLGSMVDAPSLLFLVGLALPGPSVSVGKNHELTGPSTQTGRDPTSFFFFPFPMFTIGDGGAVIHNNNIKCHHYLSFSL
jgi:hypothetical protein